MVSILVVSQRLPSVIAIAKKTVITEHSTNISGHNETITFATELLASSNQKLSSIRPTPNR